MSNKPQITATIKFRDVTIENMTIEELKALRDVLNQVVGDKKEYITLPTPYPVYPSQPWRPYWVTTGINTNTSDKITLDSGTGTGELQYAADDPNRFDGGYQWGDTVRHYTISCAN